MCPAPIDIRVDEASYQWTDARPREGCYGEQGHGMVHLFWHEQVADSAARDAQECTACQALKEARDDDGLDILRHSAGNDPDGK